MDKFKAATQTKVVSVEVDGHTYELRRLTLGELSEMRKAQSELKDDVDAQMEMTYQTLEKVGLPREATDQLAPEDVVTITELVASAKKK